MLRSVSSGSEPLSLPCWCAPAAVGLLVAIAIVLVQGYRLSMAPDIFSDETLYLTVSTNVAAGHGLRELDRAFFWHPPFFMLVSAAYIKLGGLLDTDIVSRLMAVRWINVVASGVTGALLYWLGRALYSQGVGLASAVLFTIDPYIQRINRRAMLETIAMGLAVLGLLLFVSRDSPPSRRRQVACGVAFGLAILTKELMAVELFVLLGYTLWRRRRQVGAALRVAGIAAGVYAIYPIWAFATGQWDDFFFFKTYNLSRFTNLYQHLGIAPPKLYESAIPTQPPPITEYVSVLLAQYWSTYLVIACAGMAMVGLWLFARRSRGAPVVISWAFVSFGVIMFGMTLGKISDQFFYFLIVPSMLTVGYAAVLLGEAARRNWKAAMACQGAGWRRAWLQVAGLAAMTPVVLIVAGFDAASWVRTYAEESDNVYAQIYYYVRANIPPGASIVVGADTANYLFLPDYDVRFDRFPESVLQADAHYFILSSKESWGNYQDITPPFYNWVMQQTYPVIEGEEETFWKVGLYYRDDALADARVNP